MAKPICKIIVGTYSFTQAEIDEIFKSLESKLKNDYFMFIIFDKGRRLLETKIEVYNADKATHSIEAVDAVIKEINNETT